MKNLVQEAARAPLRELSMRKVDLSKARLRKRPDALRCNRKQ